MLLHYSRKKIYCYFLGLRGKKNAPQETKMAEECRRESRLAFLLHCFILILFFLCVCVCVLWPKCDRRETTGHVKDAQEFLVDVSKSYLILPQVRRWGWQRETWSGSWAERAAQKSECKEGRDSILNCKCNRFTVSGWRREECKSALGQSVFTCFWMFSMRTVTRL